ncbi:MAG: 6-pyruvoyl tetrahydropterin synthase family protein [Phycisphaeraceae bacterium]|nr:6-pyruvoyl tetrahydropterin synthase family protein [Phycisphaeraceae bacterium]
MFEITVTGQFTATHAIRLYDGSWEQPHPHLWRVRVTVAAERLDSIGVVMDFHELEGMIRAIVQPAENGNLNKVAPFSGPGGVNPTAEEVAGWIGREIHKRLPAGRLLKSVRIREAEGCEGVYRP